MNALDPVPDTAAFDCPRCGSAVSEPFYGPCALCRGAMRDAISGEAREVAAADYIPKMNVTPNAVATKD